MSGFKLSVFTEGLRTTLPVQYESVGGDGEQIQIVKRVFCIGSILHQAEQQAEL